MSRYTSFLVFGIIALVFLCNACEKESFSESGEIKLEFSVDTLRFDTVFTTLGSATRFLKIYNPSTENVRIADISFENGQDSPFRINVDGNVGNSVQNIEVRSKDSVYVFAEVTIDPDQPLSSSPFVIEEYLNFTTNGNKQQVLLEAWGQNANYIPSRYSQGTFNRLSCVNLDSLYWDDPKPYVIYGALFVDSCNLVLPAGTQVYIHGGLGNLDGAIYNDGLWVFEENGSLTSHGTVDNPVIIQGDRLESNFSDVSGQWAGIRLTSTKRKNRLNHTTIKNSLVGIRVDSASNVNLNACQIYNTSGSGLIGIRSNINAQNTLIHSNGGNAVLMTFGGTYNFDYCTLASYGNQAAALYMDNFACTDPFCSGQIFVYPARLRVRNSIIHGSNGDEIDLSDATGGNEPNTFNYQLDNCIIAIEKLSDAPEFGNFLENCNACVDAGNDDILFRDVDESNYQLDTMSIAEEMALPLTGISQDILGVSRDSQTPDIGCYEFED